MPGHTPTQKVSYSLTMLFILGVNRLKLSVFGDLCDADVHAQNNQNGFEDDICGFRQSLPAFYSTNRCEWEDTINIA